MTLIESGGWTGRIFTGEWVDTGRTLPSTEPATGRELGRVGAAGAEELAAAAERAVVAGAEWAARPYSERAEMLRRAAGILEENRGEIRSWLQREAGKVRPAAELELSLAIEEIWQAVSLTLQPWGQLLPTARPGRISTARRVPVGVVAVIAPWNFPLNLAMRSVAPALACGNAVILKPASETAISAGVSIARLFEQAGLPPGVLHLLPGKGSELGTAFADDPNVDMISFTGSTPVGKSLSEAAGRNLVRMVAELGGNNPFIVLDDADVDKAAAAGAFGSFTHQGQICMAIGRHLVADSVADHYVEALSRLASKMTVGDPTGDVDLGPVINHSQLDSILDVIKRTGEEGGAVTTGGEADGLFLRPTVIAGVEPGMAAEAEEIFGPVAPVIRFAGDADAVEIANRSPFGLVAGVHSGSAPRARSVADRLHAGMVHINDQTVNDEVIAPFGGRGDSGMGAFGTLTNLDQFTRWQWVTYHDDQAPPPA